MANRYDRSVFAELIERARDGVGLTQAALAQTLGVGQQSVSKWERGETKPRPSAMPALAEVLGIATNVLLVEAGYLAAPPDADSDPDIAAIEQRLPDGSMRTLRIARSGVAIPPEWPPRPTSDAVPADDELAELRREVAELRAIVERLSGTSRGGPAQGGEGG